MTACKYFLISTLFLLAALLPARAAEPTAKNDVAFVASEQHEERKLTEEGREGWIERKDTVRFGPYSFYVTQRLDPNTGNPPEAQKWGDSFVGFLGKKVAFYMASGWGSSDFMTVKIRLAGDDRDLPNIVRMRALAYATIREVTPERIVAELAWEDGLGGYLRLRFMGIKGVDRCGMSLRYFPPPGREAEKITYAFQSNPYELTDRGEWARKRWFATPQRNAEVKQAETALDMEKEWLVSCYNRFGMETAGTVAAFDPLSVQSLTIRQEWVCIYLTATPKDPSADMHMILGDWVFEANNIVTANFFAAKKDIEDEIASLAVVGNPPLPLRDEDDDDDITRLLAADAALAEKHLAAVVALRREEEAAIEAVAESDNPETVARWYNAGRKLTAEYRAAKGDWVKLKRWEAAQIP